LMKVTVTTTGELFKEIKVIDKDFTVFSDEI
jgi:hypothetical protein